MELVAGVAQMRPEDAMAEAMLRGWRAQQAARGLSGGCTAGPRELVVRRFLEFTNEYPWAWTAAHLDERSVHLTAEKHLAVSTVRGYQGALRLFTEFLTDGRYGWAGACEEAFGPGCYPVAIAHEWNTISHLQGYEGRPEARPFTREELQRFFDYADDQVERITRAKRKGALAAYRDATLFKVIYGWGLRRQEAAFLDLADFGRNAAAAEFGRYGMLGVRYGKAKRGQLGKQPCQRCCLDQAVTHALSDPASVIRDGLQALRQALLATERPATVQAWMARPASRALLRELARDQRPLTHEILDQFPPGRPLAPLSAKLR